MNVISQQLQDKNSREKRQIKGQEIAKNLTTGKKIRSQYEIEIVSVETTLDGLNVFARAWDKNGNQIGFGADGTVDIERFRFVNPPVLVHDPLGDITRDFVDIDTGEQKQITLREDSREAILQALEHTISVKEEKFSSKNIVRGKVGNTTTTVYPDADTESTSVDGFVQLATSGETWSGIRNAANGTSVADSGAGGSPVLGLESDNTWGVFRREVFLFDTSSITDTDTISSATLSVKRDDSVSAFIDDLSQSMGIVSSAPASNTALATGDYDSFGTTDFATRIALSATSNGSYSDFALNASGLANISKTGVSKFGLRLSSDIDDSEPTHSANDTSRIGHVYADTSGTASDPVLVIEHAAVTFTPTASFFM